MLFIQLQARLRSENMKRLFLLSLACIALSSAADETEPEASASKPLVYYPQPQDYQGRRGDKDDNDHRKFRDGDDDYDDNQHGYSYGAQQIRNHRYNSEERKIIEDFYNPDYYEPTTIIDYRYLKSGGRDYIRGPGGQILILPKNVRSDGNKEHHDYDSLIDFLRLRNLAKSRDDHNLSPNSHYEDENHHQKDNLPWY